MRGRLLIGSALIGLTAIACSGDGKVDVNASQSPSQNGLPTGIPNLPGGTSKKGCEIMTAGQFGTAVGGTYTSNDFSFAGAAGCVYSSQDGKGGAMFAYPAAFGFEAAFNAGLAQAQAEGDFSAATDVSGVGKRAKFLFKTENGNGSGILVAETDGNIIMVVVTGSGLTEDGAKTSATAAAKVAVGNL